MRPKRSWWSTAGVGAVLLAVALIGQRSLPFVGAVALGTYCLVTATRAVSAFTTTHGGLAVDVDATPERVPAGGETTLTVTVTLDLPADHPVTVDLSFPAGVDTDSQTVTVPPGETQVQGVCAPVFPVAGRFTLPDLVVAYESPDGTFTQRVPLEGGTSVRAEAHGTGGIHVGVGGDAVVGTFGSHRDDSRGGRGDDFATIREYEPGDSVRRIDWKTTARLDEPHVREYEPERERMTRLVVDARSRLTTGEPGRTELDYLREVALGVLRQAEADDDPLALTVVDDRGIRTDTDAAGTSDHYQQIRETLLGLGTDPRAEQYWPVTGRFGPAEAQSAYTALAGRDGMPTSFERVLMPYFSRTGSYVAQLSADPLFAALQQHATEGSRGTWTVCLTDDTERRQLVETMKLATRGSRRATAFVTPSVLFEPRDLTELETAYERLVEFEEFRRRLDRLPRSNAYEVAPDGRLRAVFASTSSDRRSRVRTR